MLDDISYWSLLTLPCLFWAAFHYYQDRHRPEPIALLLLAICLGYLSGYLGLFLYQSLDFFGLRFDAFSLADESQWMLLAYCLFAIGPIEEIAKFTPFLLVLIHSPHFDEPLDGVIYASFIALGFSFNENQNYLLFLEAKEAVARAIAAPMVHILFASIWGYAYGYADIHNINRATATALGLVLSFFLHGIFDFFSLYISVWTHIMPPLIILGIWLLRMYLVRRHQSLDPH